ncbi:hypothetical protein ACX0G7_18115 [Flavitalea antarctica]
MQRRNFVRSIGLAIPEQDQTSREPFENLAMSRDHVLKKKW